MVEYGEMDIPFEEAKIPQGNEEQSAPNRSQDSGQELRGKGNTKIPDSPPVISLNHYFHLGFRCARRLIKDTSQILVELRVQELWKEFKVLLCNHPLAALIIAIVSIACGIPILIFVTFAIATLIFTFGGFLIIEGAVLAAGSFALLLCLCTMIIVFITLGFIGGLLYVTYMQIDSMIRINSVSRETVQSFDARLPQVLASMRHLPQSNPRHAKGLYTSVSSNAMYGHKHVHHSK